MQRIGRVDQDQDQDHQRREDPGHQRNQESHHPEKHQAPELCHEVQVGRLFLLRYVHPIPPKSLLYLLCHLPEIPLPLFLLSQL